jgi:uncharacterized protein (TIGR02265 family)
MQAERRVSGRFVEWIFGSAKGEAVAQTLRAAGLDLAALTPDYPAERLPQWLSLLSEVRHPQASRAEALRRVGFEAALKAAGGKTLDEVMSALPANTERIGNFFDVSVREHGPHRYVAHFDDAAFVPTFFLGVLQGATSTSGTGPAEVTWSPEGLSGARYDVTVR